ncbi:hypothetical protein [Streptomyces sp. 061-3]|uniref:hypothetical protein n=1 Tax=Streptomyces sp. 061-3 TaxID=2789268 RepID=UPI00397F57B7
MLEAIRGSYDTALEAIERRCGKVVGKRQAEQLVRAAAQDVVGFYGQRRPAAASADTLLVLSADAKGVVMRPGHLREATRKAAERAQHTFRTRLAAGEKANRKRMATLAAVYGADLAVRRPHDVIAPPGGRTGTRPPRPGPKARAKWLVIRKAEQPVTNRDVPWRHLARLSIALRQQHATVHEMKPRKKAAAKKTAKKAPAKRAAAKKTTAKKTSSRKPRSA